MKIEESKLDIQKKFEKKLGYWFHQEEISSIFEKLLFETKTIKSLQIV